MRMPYARVRLGRHQVVRPFSAEEDALITEARIANLGTTAIARLVNGRSPATINMRLKALAVREEADA